MGKVYYVMGKSASGKDTIYKKILDTVPKMKPIIQYTTRPIRDRETDGVEYYFVDKDTIDRFEKEGKLIEERTYDTALGDWTYATIDDGQIHLDKRNYIVIGTLESYEKVREYFGIDNVRPIFIQLDPGIRLQRALNRENMQQEPHYEEMCRRFIADEKDFSEDRLYAAGITKRYLNEDLGKCLKAIMEDIESDAEHK